MNAKPNFTQAATQKEKSDSYKRELKQFLLTEANRKIRAEAIYWMSAFGCFFFILLLYVINNPNTRNGNVCS